jgi:UDP-3-O-[3-hydroxymyristoyl] glucosamine N-acyltransferase
MIPDRFFNSSQIIRGRDFSLTYALNQELKNSIAYANDLRAVRFLNKIPSVAAIITTAEISGQVNESKGLIVSENPKKDFFQLHNFLVEGNHFPPLNRAFVDPTAIIAPTAKIGNHVFIGKNVVINDYALIEPNTIIGDHCEVEAFAVIGAKSMQQTIIEDQLFHLKYAGGVKIGCRTRILTGAIIQKPYQAFYTTIGCDSVISTRVIIGHGSMVGNRTMLSGGAGIAGNCILGDDVWVGGGAMIADGIKIGDQARVLVGSVVVKDVKPDSVVSGNFAFDHKKNLRIQLKQWQ